MRLNGWKRLFLVYVVVAAFGSYALAFEKVRELRIVQQNQIEAFNASNCYPPDIGILCKEQIKILQSYEDELEYALPKYFLTLFGLSTLICYFIFQTFMFVRRGFLSND